MNKPTVAYCKIYETSLPTTACQKGMDYTILTCEACQGDSLVEVSAHISMCECGQAGNHEGWCSHRKSFFEPYKPLTAKQEVYADMRLSGASREESYNSAGLAPVVDVQRAAARLDSQDNVQNHMANTLRRIAEERDGGEDVESKISRVVIEAMDAGNVKVRKTYEYDKETKVQKPVFTQIVTPDHETRLRASRDAREILGYKKDGTATAGSTTINVLIDGRGNVGVRLSE